jgi:hypothetical protein
MVTLHAEGQLERIASGEDSLTHAESGARSTEDMITALWPCLLGAGGNMDGTQQENSIEESTTEEESGGGDEEFIGDVGVVAAPTCGLESLTLAQKYINVEEELKKSGIAKELKRMMVDIEKAKERQKKYLDWGVPYVAQRRAFPRGLFNVHENKCVLTV